MGAEAPDAGRGAAAAGEGPAWPADPATAVEMLMARYGDLVLRLAYLHLGDRREAEDVSQEVFLKAFRAWGALRDAGSVRSWLARITVNACRDALRRGARRELPFSSLTERSAPAGDEPDPPAGAPGVALLAAEAPDPADEAVGRAAGEALLRSALGLPEEIRQVVFLYYYFELSTVEIARALACPEGTVRSRLARGRDHLRRALAERGWGA